MSDYDARTFEQGSAPMAGGENLSAYVNDLVTALARKDAAIDRLLVALEQIAKAEGAYSRDPLTHAGNVIDNMVRIATDALYTERGIAG